MSEAVAGVYTRFVALSEPATNNFLRESDNGDMHGDQGNLRRYQQASRYSIPELSGARRDATALWALFSDTIEGLSARLLVDEAATHTEVSSAMLGTLAAAGADDVVVIAFAGHGSPDGNLVLFDTNASDLAGTALSMAGLADAFKATKARAVLCILDCCFSGQAPARVLETAARPRSAFALTDIYGEGRILLAARATNESAWEQPGTGHGLLTHAVIEAQNLQPCRHSAGFS
ncbi:caspase family protein [Burkholderia oklahomensis]|uniref:caspase family protein n=1 Tax=Burkholderia oklahomensis TaxID=342113 RepID=UPI00264B2DCC|nr:caspase family protein [Burkholderia oklahomensis]MDN7671081.1 caspase family protein [Burkholderia oklahomensis]